MGQRHPIAEETGLQLIDVIDMSGCLWSTVNGALTPHFGRIPLEQNQMMCG